MRALVGSWLGLLVVLGVVLAVQAANQTNRDHRLQRAGVPVAVTVTRCVGQASGTGITVTGFTCSGTFELDGVRHTDVIGGSSELLGRGETLQAVTDPRHPSVLRVAAAVATAGPSWKRFIPAAIVFLLLMLSVACATVLTRGGRARGRPARITFGR